MARVWDILPPRKTRRKLKPKEKKARRVNVAWIFFLVVIAAFFIAFKGANQTPSSTSPEAKTPTETATVKTSPTKSPGKMTIKLLNGTGRVEETDKVRKILQSTGFELTITENALNIYDQTIVYFQPLYEQSANEIADSLSAYQAKTQKFSEETNYDIVIVIGSK